MSRAGSETSHASMRHGLLSLLTVIVVVSLATAAVLAIATSRAMSALAERQATMTAEGYAAERSAQTMLAGLDEALLEARASGRAGSDARALVAARADELVGEGCAEGVEATYSLDNDILTCTYVTTNNRMLEVQVIIGDDARYEVASWKLTAVPEEVDMGGNLWTGSLD